MPSTETSCLLWALQSESREKRQYVAAIDLLHGAAIVQDWLENCLATTRRTTEQKFKMTGAAPSGSCTVQQHRRRMACQTHVELENPGSIQLDSTAPRRIRRLQSRLKLKLSWSYDL